MPKISVIIPIYNVEKTLARCLDSVLSQTFQDFEIICVNDHSPDNSSAIITQYLKKYPNVISVINHETNKGLGAARNAALAHATGDYISFIDSDDTVSLNFLEELYKSAIQQNADVVMGNLQVTAPDKIEINNIKRRTYKRFIDKISILSNGSSCDKLWRRDLLLANSIDFPTGMYYEDNLFVIKALYCSKIFCVTDKPIYYYHVNPSSITRNIANISKRKEDLIHLTNAIMDYAKERSFSNKELNAVCLFMAKSILRAPCYCKDPTFISLLPAPFQNPDILFPMEFHGLERILAIKSTHNKQYKVINICGIKIKLNQNRDSE